MMKVSGDNEIRKIVMNRKKEIKSKILTIYKGDATMKWKKFLYKKGG